MCSESKLDEVEEALRKKVETISGFAEAEVQARKLELTFKHFDTDNSGVIDYDEFNSAMTRLNFVGVQREIEGLFDRFDEDDSGTINYKEFALHLFGLGPHLVPDAASRSVVERVKAKIIERGGANGIRTLTRILRRMDKDGSLTLDAGELKQGLEVYGLRDLDDSDGGDMDKLLKYFDRDGSGRISVEEFLRGVKGTMPKRRIKLVRQAFGLLDKTGDGIVNVEDFRQAYDTSEHPEVIAGRMTQDEALEDFMEVFEQQVDGIIEWREFLDYYKDISAGIDLDDYFELMIRNAWHMSGGEGWCANTSCRRVLVTYEDGSQEVVEIENDLGLKSDDIEGMIKRLEDQGVTGIKKISLAD